MRLKVVVHEADEGGLWAEIPAIPGCATEGDTFEELLTNLYEAIEGEMPSRTPVRPWVTRERKNSCRRPRCHLRRRRCRRPRDGRSCARRWRPRAPCGAAAARSSVPAGFVVSPDNRYLYGGLRKRPLRRLHPVSSEDCSP